MRFTTNSGTTYELTEIQELEGQTGWTAYIVRNGVPLRDLTFGGEMAELAAQHISFTEMPALGESFRYWSDTHFGCISTPIASFDDYDYSAAKWQRSPEHGPMP